MPGSHSVGLAQFDALVAEMMAEWADPGFGDGSARGRGPAAAPLGLAQHQHRCAGDARHRVPDLLGHKILHRDRYCIAGRQGPARLGRAGAYGFAGVSTARYGCDRAGELARFADPPYRIAAARLGYIWSPPR